jgi:hypothetical protein
LFTYAGGVTVATGPGLIVGAEVVEVASIINLRKTVK